MQLLHVGLDIGSTTAKAVVLDGEDSLIYSRYRRHFSDICTTVGELMREIKASCKNYEVTLAAAGSGAIALAEEMNIPFTQELIACSASVERYIPTADVCIELGGEDAKLTFFGKNGADQRMNETCAGGTGAFLDHMSMLLGTDAAGLNELAGGYKTIYPIASRCGVFAKTDVQSLMKDGAAREDIAASIFQAVVNQTISGLACGRKICGNVAFLGGPLYFLSELRKRFMETLGLLPEQCISPQNSHLFVAIGAAILGKKNEAVDIAELRKKAAKFFSTGKVSAINTLPPLFPDNAARAEFKARHSMTHVRREDISRSSGDAYLGIDVGSTTTKVVLIGKEGELLFSDYRTVGGSNPVQTVKEMLIKLYSKVPPGLNIRNSGVTGYGEKLIQAAFGVDIGEIETVAHAKAAEFIDPNVDFIIDIGGQDMKCLRVENGIIRQVFLNEACSSGCGSFLQNFAESLGMTMEEFVFSAEDSKKPVDLGSRCTVFMNSRVRQAQKEGACVSDISAGLAYSVVRNALYKVLKIRSADKIGNHIVVQGGTFKNDALLRAFELVTGREVIRPDISELMGAFGAALLARDRYDGQKSGLASYESLASFRAGTSTGRCSGCGNKCILTYTMFGGGRSYITGNMCENGILAGKRKKDLPPNLYAAKYNRLFDYYRPITAEAARRGTVSIPRVLNIYENYPFWFTLFTSLGFRVELSSSHPGETLGIDTVPSQTICFPAKLAHRHIIELLDRGADLIFYPGVQKEVNEFPDADNHYNCPVIAGYPDVAWLNIDRLHDDGVRFVHRFFPIDSPEKMVGAMADEFKDYDLRRDEIQRALKEAYEAQRQFKLDIESFGDEALDYVKEHNITGIVLAGHPYHLDPAVNHGIPELINGYNIAVFTEDSICGKADRIIGHDSLTVIDQWVYHSRLYRAASVIAQDPDFNNIHMVQLNSFGCGLDAISADQTASLLEQNGRLHTLIKIDESKNNGAVRIRIRSLLAAIDRTLPLRKGGYRTETALASIPSKNMDQKDRTILCPPLSKYHFQFIEAIMREEGLDFHVLPEGGRESVELGLSYVNNDACYPVMVVVGQFLKALKSGEFDPENTDCFYVQTGGACRASNYVSLLRMALDEAGFKKVRILAINAQGRNAKKFTLPGRVLFRSAMGLLYGDLLMRLLLRTRPYELEKGSAQKLYDRFSQLYRDNIVRNSWWMFKKLVRDTVAGFASLPISEKPKPRVGIVGEILVKYHSGANDHLIDIIEGEGGEAVLTDLTAFLLYCLYDPVYLNRKLSGSFLASLAGQAGISALEFMRRPIRQALQGTRFGQIHDIYSLAKKAEEVVSCGNQAGEGWLLSAEMMSLIESGIKNVICIQPFACLPNHITGKGVIKELKRRYDGTNILALDYDSSASTVNQMNRIRLLMATTRI
ncbi:MAG: acyl-CoA dehydratase activase [Synergistaceae bacterium]|nr:acyl-CoA dehydratase activase [Synergistaceae bacterium]